MYAETRRTPGITERRGGHKGSRRDTGNTGGHGEARRTQRKTVAREDAKNAKGGAGIGSSGAVEAALAGESHDGVGSGGETCGDSGFAARTHGRICQPDISARQVEITMDFDEACRSGSRTSHTVRAGTGWGGGPRSNRLGRWRFAVCPGPVAPDLRRTGRQILRSSGCTAAGVWKGRCLGEHPDDGQSPVGQRVEIEDGAFKWEGLLELLSRPKGVTLWFGMSTAQMRPSGSPKTRGARKSPGPLSGPAQDIDGPEVAERVDRDDSLRSRSASGGHSLAHGDVTGTCNQQPARRRARRKRS